MSELSFAKLLAEFEEAVLAKDHAQNQSAAVRRMANAEYSRCLEALGKYVRSLY